MSRNQGFSVLIIVIILAVLIAGGFMVWKDQTVAPTTDTSDWKTYEDEKHGFKVKYPPDIAIKDFGKPDYSDEVGLSFCGGEYSNSCGVKGAGPHPEIYLSRFSKDGERKELYSFVFGDGKFPRDYWPWGNTLDAMNCSVVSKEISEVSGKLWNCEIGLFAFWEKENSFYSMNVSFLDKFPNLRGTFLEILNTFKFTNPVDTSTWKTYRNEEYGFEFKYPGDWSFEDTSKYPNQNSVRIINDKGYKFRIDPKDKGSKPNCMLDESIINNYQKLALSMGDVWRSEKPALPEEPMGGIYYFDFILPKFYQTLNEDGFIGECYTAVSLLGTKFDYYFNYELPKGITDENYNDDVIQKIDQILSTFRFTK